MNLLTGAGGKFVASVSGHAMVTPLLWSSDNLGAPSTTAANYTGIVSGLFNSSASNVIDNPSPIAGTISNLYVRFPTTLSQGTYDISLTIGGTAQALTCQITTSTTTCNDTTHSVSISAADLIGWKVCPSNATGCAAGSAPTAQSGVVQIGATFTSTNNGESAFFSGRQSGSPSSTAVNYTAPSAATVWNATENLVSGVMPTAGVVDHFYVTTNSAPGTGASYQFYLVKNGSITGTPPTCTITGTGTGAGKTTCNDLTNSLTFAAGDTLSIEACPSNTATCPAGSAPTAGVTRFGMRWTPTTPGEAVAFSVLASNIGTTTPRFMQFQGQGFNDTETNNCNVIPSSFTVKKPYFLVGANPGGTATRTMTLRGTNCTGQSAQGTPASVACTITNAISSCQDNTNTFATSASQLLNWDQTSANSPAASVFVKVGTVMYTP